MNRWVRAVCVAALFGAVAMGVEAAPPQYKLTVLSTIGRTWSFGIGISENGQVAINGLDLLDIGGQQFATNYLSAVFDHGVTSVLPLAPGLANSSVYAVNDSGAVAGYAYNQINGGQFLVPDSTTQRAFSGGAGGIVDLGGLRSSARAINNAGQVAGRSRFAGANHAALFFGGQVTDLGTLPGDSSSSGSAINAAGTVAGSSTSASGYQNAVLFTNGQVVNLGADAFGYGSVATGINDAGQVVGATFTAAGAVPFLYDHATVTTFGTLGGLDYAQAYDINNKGWIVGMAIYPDVPYNIPFLRTDGVFVDLNTLVTPASKGDYLISDAYAINDSGQIAGSVWRNGVLTAALLTPVPEPASLQMLVLGVIALLLLRSVRGTRRLRRVAMA
jgi:probable HAF family extracellular repeat protein